MFWFPYNFRQFSLLQRKVYFLCAWTLFLFLSNKFQILEKAVCAVCIYLHFPYHLGPVGHICHILGVVWISLCGVQIIIWCTAGELVYNALPFLSCIQFWFLFGIDGFPKVRMYVWVCMVSSFRRIVTQLYSFIPCFLKAVSISSGVASDSS